MAVSYWKKVVAVVAAVAVLAGVALTVALLVYDSEAPTEDVVFQSAAAVSDGTPCAQIATDILARNGTAADAVIASLFCSGVVNPHSMGIGGGFLLTYYHRESRQAFTLIARETAPAAATEDMYGGDAELSYNGGLAVAVPGEVAGYAALYERFGGGVPWAELIAPSVALCRDGFPVHFHLARALQSTRDYIVNEPSMRVFMDSNNEDVLKEGDILKQPVLGESLEALQEDPHSMRNGSLADKLVDDFGKMGVIISKDDLANYEVLWNDPIQVNLTKGDNEELNLYSVPPPGSGSVLGFILNVLDGYRLTKKDASEDREVVTHQRIVETFKYAYAQRTWLGDPFDDEYHDSILEVVANLTSEVFAEEVRALISDNTTWQDPGHYGASTAGAEDHGTSHQSVLSQAGDAAAATSTINTYFGAKIISESTGIVLNNEMDDFSSDGFSNNYGVPPSPENFIKPGKRPLSSMCPAVVVAAAGGDVRLVTGAAGGTRITSGVAYQALRYLWLGRPLPASVEDLRLHHQTVPMEISHEEGFSQSILEGLVAIGHEITPSSSFAVVGAIGRDADGIRAAADWRKAGQAAGY